MYRRPARDHNYEFWGDQTFYGENPPQAAVLQWFLKKDAGEVKLKISDAVTGKEIREISGQVLANSNKAGHAGGVLGPARAAAAAFAGGTRGPGRARSAVKPGRACAGGRGRPGCAAACAGDGAWHAVAAAARRSPFGAGCGGGGGALAGAASAAAAAAPPARSCCRALTRVALVVDGKTVDTKPLKVAADPEVGLTAIERKKMYDMAMEMHELQRVATQVVGRHHAAQHAAGRAVEGDGQPEGRAGRREGVGRGAR